MPRRASLLPALVAVAAVGTSTATVAPAGAVTATAAAPVRVPASAADEADPLQVRIASLTPSYLPERGTIRMTGRVTNSSDERWRNINVYSFISATPLTSSAELAATATEPVDSVVGERITDAGTFDDIGSLAPGESARFVVRLRRDQVPVSEAGVYWFGAHALGNTTEARDLDADGRARTLLPLVPGSTPGRAKAAVVIPVRRAIRHDPSGRLRAPARWAADLDEGGRLRALVDFGAAATQPVTWLVDPAVPDAVARLVSGNRARVVGDTRSGGGDDPGDETDDGSGDGEPAPDAPSSSADLVEPGDDPVDEPGDESEESGDAVASNPAADPGSEWLAAFEDALAGHQVLTLPYGDLDVPASSSYFYDLAARRVGAELASWRVRPDPAVATPDGFLPETSLSMLGGDETVILSDAALPAEEPLTTGRAAGRRVLFGSSATAAGGPAPGDPLDEVALRQRFVAEAAVRLLFHDRTPLLLVLPAAWAPSSPERFWSGLEAPWLELTGTDELGRAQPVEPSDLRYPVEQELVELDVANFEAAQQLLAAGRTLDNLLPRNDVVAGQVLVEALTSVSYSERDRAVESRTDTESAVTWISQRLQRVRMRAPQGVTLSGDSGQFSTVVTNRLDQPVTVRLRAVSLGEVSVAPSAPIDLAAGGRQTVFLDAEAAAPGVHYVRVEVTDEDGNPIGASQRVAVRSAQVSDVIWLILGVGVGLLFLAIALRVVRRVRSERA